MSVNRCAWYLDRMKQSKPTTTVASKRVRPKQDLTAKKLLIGRNYSYEQVISGRSTEEIHEAICRDNTQEDGSELVALDTLRKLFAGESAQPERAVRVALARFFGYPNPDSPMTPYHIEVRERTKAASATDLPDDVGRSMTELMHSFSTSLASTTDQTRAIASKLLDHPKLSAYASIVIHWLDRHS